MTTNQTLDKITIDLGEIRITLRDIKIIIDGQQLAGVDRLLFKLLGGGKQCSN